MKLTIIESTSGVMQAILSSAFTAQTNLISPTTVYCAYPNLVGDQNCIRTDLPQYRPYPRPSSIYNVLSDNSLWKRPCRYHCPSVPRNTAEDKGIATFTWNLAIEKPTSARKGSDHMLGDQVVSWKFASSCRNAHCKRFVPGPAHGCRAGWMDM